MHRTRFAPWVIALCLGLGYFPSTSSGNGDVVKQLQKAAADYEQAFDWDRACDCYDHLLRLQRDLPDLRARSFHAQRRLAQTRRHQDPTFLKEVLGLDYGKALQLFGVVRDTVLDSSVNKRKLDPAKLFRKGLEEFDAALASPVFRKQHLPDARPADVTAFRGLLDRKWGNARPQTRPETLKLLREVTMTAQSYLRVNATVTVMEFTCGLCAAADDYTGYLTPGQLHDLSQSIRGEAPAGSQTPAASVSHEMKGEGIAYLHVGSFHKGTVGEVDAALAALQRDGMKALLLDLRGNGGGVFEAAIDTARRFLSSGTITSTLHHDTRNNTVYQARGDAAVTVPVVVLIDADTASAAEVLAGALKGNNRARLVGQTTFGKGCTQCVLKLPAGSGGLRLTLAHFFSPRGEVYAGRGVTPDLPVAPATSVSTHDMALQTAFLEAQRMLAQNP